jgi:fucose permease
VARARAHPDAATGCYVPVVAGGPGAEIRAWRNAVFVVFTLNGVELASWTSRTPTVRDSLHASTAQMGLIIFGLAVGSVVGLTASSHFIARIGGRTAIRTALLASAAGLTVVGLGA